MPERQVHHYHHHAGVNDRELPEEFIELLDGLSHEGLDEAGRARLLAMVTEQPHLLAEVSVQLTVSRALMELGRGGEDRFAEITASHIAKIAGEEESAFPQKVVGRIVRRRLVAGLAMAAVIVFLAVLIFRPRTANDRGEEMAVSPPEPPAEVAVLMRLQTGDESGKPVRAGQVFSEERGLMRFEFNNGAIVAIEAPAKFVVVSAKEITLESGRLNAWCPDTAHGFKVRTASGSLTDLGTSFGIRVTPEHSEFVVLDGLVEVEKGSEKIQVTEGNAVQANQSTPLNTLAFAPADFRATWALAYGILSTRGAAVPPDPDLLEKLVDLEDDDNLLVIPEKRNVPFDEPIKAEVLHPGTMPGENPHDMNGTVFILPPEEGKRLSSFIIRYNPVGIVTEEHFKRFSGEVTFDRPVLAIQGLKATLEDGDSMFATGTWSKEGFRGMELSQYFNPPDSVTLSEDRRTVSVVFYTGASTDDVRVILEDN